MTTAARDMTAPAGILSRIELVLVFVCLLLLSGGVVHRLVASDELVDGSVILRVMWVPVYAIVLGLAITRLRDILTLALRMPLLSLLVVLSLVSLVWSIDPALTFRRAIACGFTTLFAYYLVVRFEPMQLLKLLGSVWIIVAVMSFGAGLLTPGFGRDHELHIGAWQGFYYEKNSLGGHMARAALIFAILVAFDAAHRRFWAAALLLAGALVILSTSATALLALLIALATVGLGTLMQRGSVFAIAIIWAGAVALGSFALILVIAPELLLDALGKDPSLTGRTYIWEALTQLISEKPVLGYGYGAFWDVESEPANWVRSVVEWDAPTAHNSWLEVLLALGSVGLAVFACSLVAILARAVASMLSHLFALYAVGALAQFLLFAMSESIIMDANTLTWISFVVVAGCLARGLGAQGRVEPRPARETALRIQHPSGVKPFMRVR